MEAAYPREKIILFYLPTHTTDKGIIYLFVGQYVFSDFVFDLGVAEEINAKEVVKAINALISHKGFASEKREEFTLVIERSVLPFIAEITQTIEQYNGSLAFNDDFVIQKAQDFGNFLEKRFQ